jgi:hypothetical protein
MKKFWLMHTQLKSHWDLDQWEDDHLHTREGCKINLVLGLVSVFWLSKLDFDLGFFGLMLCGAFTV